MSNVTIIGELNHKIQKAKENLFTGILAIGTDTEVEWFLYFLVGQIVWANTRTHSKRRWHRQFLKYSSYLSPKTIHDIAHRPQNYKTVAQLVMQQQFSREQFSQIVVGCISEVLFDIIHQATLAYNHSKTRLVYKVSNRNGANFPCIGLHREPVWERVQQEWHSWQQAKLVDYCPNLAPVIVRADILKERTSETVFQNLRSLANGQETLRDLAIKTGKPLAALTQSLIPHIRRDLIKLVNVGDLSVNKPSQPHSTVSSLIKSAGDKNRLPSRLPKGAPCKPHPLISTEIGLTASQIINATRNKAVVAYVDDNPADSQAMATIFQGSDYRYVNIPDPLQALPKLLALKPQLIFLDLVMPVVNGYELCAQIRRISAFKHVPVIIMTNNNSIPDRVRAKVVGANGFLGKPIKPKPVLKAVIKHLSSKEIQPAASPIPVHFRNSLQPTI